MSYKWKVDVKGDVVSGWEIAVVREDNIHGFRSYGWFGEEKILISHNGGPCRWPIPKYIFDASIDLAGEVAEALNEGASYQEVMMVSYK